MAYLDMLHLAYIRVDENWRGCQGTWRTRLVSLNRGFMCASHNNAQVRSHVVRRQEYGFRFLRSARVRSFVCYAVNDSLLLEKILDPNEHQQSESRVATCIRKIELSCPSRPNLM